MIKMRGQFLADGQNPTRGKSQQFTGTEDLQLSSAHFWAGPKHMGPVLQESHLVALTKFLGFFQVIGKTEKMNQEKRLGMGIPGQSVFQPPPIGRQVVLNRIKFQGNRSVSQRFQDLVAKIIWDPDGNFFRTLGPAPGVNSGGQGETAAPVIADGIFTIAIAIAIPDFAFGDRGEQAFQEVSETRERRCWDT
jgi:hypothetical protein